MTDTNTSGADVLDLLEEMPLIITAAVCDPDDRRLVGINARTRRARTAVAALIEREAALSDELTVCRHKLTGVDVLTKLVESLRTECVQAEAERDALAAEVKALREDAKRWQEVARRYDASTTSRAVMVLQGLGLEETPYRSFAENIDAARASAATGGRIGG